MLSMMLEEVVVVRVAVSTTCFNPSLSWRVENRQEGVTRRG